MKTQTTTYTVVWTIGNQCQKHSGSHLYCTRNRSEYRSRAEAERAMTALLARADVCSAMIEVGTADDED